MTKNVGTIDRIIRAIVGLAAITAYFFGLAEGTAAIVLLVVGVVITATASLSWCPPYSLLGIDTCSHKESHR